jgi:DNA-binding response OmpR family regulator
MHTGQTILVIEDEKKISEIVKVYLEKEGFRVILATTGVEGLKSLKESPDLIILDLMLPDMQGEELCKTIREGSDVPVIMLTAKSGEEDRVKGLGIGADDYVIKPFSPRELVARVKAHLRRAVKTRRKISSYNKGTLKIDVENHEAFHDGNQIVLTPTEFKILVSLAENAGRVLSRDQLVNIVLGYDFEGYDRTIDAHVKNLRHKVEKNSRSPEFIQTVYAMGYKFIGTIDEE